MKVAISHLLNRLQDIWTLTDFSHDELTQYARTQTFDDIRISLSIGLVELTKDMAFGLDQVYQRADQTMYRAKLKKRQAQNISQIEITEIG